MSTLALVRHAQASFFAENYDQLSPVGHEQARLLGEYWVGRGLRFDEVYTGPRARQIETANLVGQAFRKAGLSWPKLQAMPEIDEHQVDRLIKLAMPEIALEYPHVGRLHADYQAAQAPHDKHRTFQLMFEEVVKLWVAGKVAVPGIHSWDEFSQGVRAGMNRILNGEARGRSVAAFSSVGAISVWMGTALGCSDHMALDLGWRLRNCSITEFVFTRGRLTLEGFNAYPHLQDPELWTYR